VAGFLRKGGLLCSERPAGFLRKGGFFTPKYALGRLLSYIILAIIGENMRIEEVKNKKDLKRFVFFPEKLYKNNTFWVPPLWISCRLSFLFRTETRLFVGIWTLRNEVPYGKSIIVCFEGAILF
jgi:hypothetical protein